MHSPPFTAIVPHRMHSCHHTALSEILNSIEGKYYYTLYIWYHMCTIFLLMQGLWVLLFGPWDSLVQKRYMGCQLCEDNAFTAWNHIWWLHWLHLMDIIVYKLTNNCRFLFGTYHSLQWEAQFLLSPCLSFSSRNPAPPIHSPTHNKSVSSNVLTISYQGWSHTLERIQSGLSFLQLLWS